MTALERRRVRTGAVPVGPNTAENGTVYDVAGGDPVGQAAGFSKL